MTTAMKNCKTVVVGDGAVGKTALLVVHTSGHFPHEYVPTIFENYVNILVVDDLQVRQLLWDTAGQEGFDHMRSMSYPGTQVFLVCFSVVNRDSFNNVTEWVAEVRKECPKTPIVLVGTKSDLRKNEDLLKELEANGKPAVLRHEVTKLMEEIGAYDYVECSALTEWHVKDVFEMAARAVLYPKKVEEEKSPCLIL